MDETTPLISDEIFPIEHVAIQDTDGANAENAQPTINCQVCNHVILLTNREKQIVARCPQCEEATPIKGAPPGKQYVRCPCHCLLICKATTSRVGCPRPNCQRIIKIAGKSGAQDRFHTGAGSSFPTDGGTFGTPPSLRVTCGNCGSPFSVTPPAAPSNGYLISCINCLAGQGGSSRVGTNHVAAKCPHCKKVTSVGLGYARIRWTLYLVMALIFLVIAISVTASTVHEASDKHVLYFLWAILYIVFGSFAFLFVSYLYMPVSHVEVPVLQT